MLQQMWLMPKIASNITPNRFSWSFCTLLCSGASPCPAFTHVMQAAHYAKSHTLAHTRTHIRTPSMHTNEIVPHFDKLYPQFPLQIFGWCWLNKRLRRVLLPATVSVYVCVCAREIECALECVCIALHGMSTDSADDPQPSVQHRKLRTASCETWVHAGASLLPCPLSPGFSVLLCSSLL